MKKTIAVVVCGLVFGCFSTVQAFYGGVNFMLTTEDLLGLVESNVDLLSFRAGQGINDNFAVEARMGSTVNDDRLYPELGINVEVDDYWGLYVRGGTRVNTTKFYLLLGYVYEELTFSWGATSETVDDSGLSYGVGVESMITEKLGWNLEYMVLPDIDFLGMDIEIVSMNLGLNYYF